MSAEVLKGVAHLNQSGGACHGEGLNPRGGAEKEKVAVGEEAPDGHCPG
ncbi:hypothetical protein [Shewanella litorisediminis]|uniref:Uncharacterized protein n=1 Tax=Shewanella litorisediminis TaxID=1173586 RepID=A0ABX7G2E2_9GAMM|nr:hypothetical protein [Shewanella litorisediminis]MCL2918628.1 hypothetical protein [Shewanella litorisediminis]QRH01452.1 hypothetical protein JQC75_16630 [Shewanella litorisediminis]